MSDRILSQHGNVIAADFRQRASLDITMQIQTETLYCDGRVMITRAITSFDGQPIATIHFMADLESGQIATL